MFIKYWQGNNAASLPYPSWWLLSSIFQWILSIFILHTFVYNDLLVVSFLPILSPLISTLFLSTSLNAFLNESENMLYFPHRLNKPIRLLTFNFWVVIIYFVNVQFSTYFHLQICTEIQNKKEKE